MIVKWYPRWYHPVSCFQPSPLRTLVVTTFKQGQIPPSFDLLKPPSSDLYITMDSWLYMNQNPELELMRWRLQVLAMGLQHQTGVMQHAAAPSAAPHQMSPFVPFHLQPGPLDQHFSSPGSTFHPSIKQEPEEPAAEQPPSHLLYRPGFQTRCGSVSPRLESRGSSSSPSSYRSSPSPTSSSTWSPVEQSEPLDLSMSTAKNPTNQSPGYKTEDQPQTSLHQDVKNIMMPPNNTTASMMQSCNVCHKEYSSPAALNMHMRTHTSGCKCQFCGKSFSRPWLLQGHIRTHTGEKPYACTQCNKSFADKSNLRAHVQTHSDVKPFSCTRCGKKFALKSYLTKHEESSCLRLTNGRY